MKQVKTPAEAARVCSRRILVAVDIGGTNTRVAYAPVPAGGEAAGEVVVVLKTNRMATMLAFLRECEAELKARGVVIVGASVAGPGPRDARGTRLGPFSNYTKEAQVLRVEDLPPAMFPAGRTALLNDLEAAAYGITSLSVHGKFNGFFEKMWGPHGADKMQLEHGPYLVLAVGTGCGSGLIHLLDGKPHVMPLEFGHTALVPHPADFELVHSLGARLYGQGKVPEYEDIVAGRGLVACYEHYRRSSPTAPKLSDPESVAKRARKGCEIARKALYTHYKYQIYLASDLSMGFVLGGVILAGDNVMHNADFVTAPDVLPRLKGDFLAHTMERYGFQSRVNVLRQSKRTSLNLAGGFYKALEASQPRAKL